mmetsp:Transcript_20750/g.37077  ORF Transcript_20750/g.37077 Transcript_20750/m.37077 type:complete len:278 (-) Transcript_20750:575-1408(-)
MCLRGVNTICLDGRDSALNTFGMLLGPQKILHPTCLLLPAPVVALCFLLVTTMRAQPTLNQVTSRIQLKQLRNLAAPAALCSAAQSWQNHLHRLWSGALGHPEPPGKFQGRMECISVSARAKARGSLEGVDSGITAMVAGGLLVAAGGLPLWAGLEPGTRAAPEAGAGADFCTGAATGAGGFSLAWLACIIRPNRFSTFLFQISNMSSRWSLLTPHIFRSISSVFITFPRRTPLTDCLSLCSITAVQRWRSIFCICFSSKREPCASSAQWFWASRIT